MRRKRSNNSHSKVALVSLISLCSLAAIYIGISLFCINHFNFGTVINGIDMSGKNIEEAENKLSVEVDKYTLTLQERGDKKEEIKAADVGLKYDSNKIKEIKDKQNPFTWIFTLVKKNDSEMPQILSFDDDMLNKTIDKLNCLNDKNIEMPKSASFTYADGAYKIEKEVLGNKINREALQDAIGKAILNVQPTLNLDSGECYEKPQYTSNSPEVVDTKTVLDKYVGTEIIYKTDNKKEVLDGSTINKWISVNDKLEISFDEAKVRNYVYKISSMYNTFGNTRSFVTTSKGTIQVSGGNYGWIVDKGKEAKELIEAVKSGQNITREPVFSQTAKAKGSNDVGNTYVEINITKQHLWFYKNGALVVEGDVVTGNASTNTLTPAGTYVLNYKERNAKLVGEDYVSPVEYWMPFNGNIGIHDASWRTEFGKQIYLTNGSHGCINSPFELAKTIYENIEAGTPIVCYYE